jgi:hypothetical protein
VHCSGIVQPESGAFTVEMQRGTYSYEWLDPNTASTADIGLVSLFTGKNTFTPLSVERRAVSQVGVIN